MSSMEALTYLVATNQNPIHEQHIYEFYYMVNQMIKEEVPALIKKELEEMDKDLLIKLKTQINGRDVDFPDVRKYFREIIEEELRKIIQEIKL